jgi:hypothetical protein
MSVRLGTFDAESWWRPADLAALPSVGGADPAIGAMDELLAGFCGPGDLLITRHPLAAPIRDGLGTALGGLRFDHVSLGDGDAGPVPPGRDVPGRAFKNVAFERVTLGDPGPGPIERHVLADQAVMERIRGREITPYAVLPETWTLASTPGPGRTNWSANSACPAPAESSARSTSWPRPSPRSTSAPW